MEFTLDRFRTAHDQDYKTALKEIKAGRKESHWIWYIFPQIQGLGHSTMATYYEIRSMDEAVAYWKDPVLSSHLLEISQELLNLEKPIEQIMGYPDNLKLQSCMTLFHLATDWDVFQEVLDKFYGGKLCEYTVNKLPRYHINDVGMKIINLLEPNLEIPFCKNTTGKDMVLCKYINKSSKPVFITISDTLLRYRIPKGGKFYCVCCEDEFVQTFPMVKCRGDEITIRTGTHFCILTDECTEYGEEGQKPICEGWLGLDYDGAILAGDYRFTLSEKNNPIVYVNSGTGIDAKGFPVRPHKYHYRYCVDSQLIAALEWGALCITSERKVLCRAKPTLEEADAAIGIATCDHGYLVQTQCGDVYFSSNGRGWQLIGDEATAIAACRNLVAWADRKGNVFVYQHDEHTLACSAVVKKPGRHIVEMDISEQFAVLKFLDGSFDVIDWHTGKTAMGDVFISPDIPK